MDDELTGCLIGLVIGLMVNAVVALVRLAFWLLTLPIKLILLGFASIQAFLIMMVVGVVLAGVLLLTDNPLSSRLNLDIPLPKLDIDPGQILHDIESGLRDIIPAPGGALALT